ncbi:hypothetical protein QE357_004567 [Siphonobacter sp. BAB-5404]|nr:hypothetical protein [Siphonobacter sp. SORGH_AS_0500]
MNLKEIHLLVNSNNLNISMKLFTPLMSILTRL